MYASYFNFSPTYFQTQNNYGSGNSEQVMNINSDITLNNSFPSYFDYNSAIPSFPGIYDGSGLDGLGLSNFLLGQDPTLLNSSQNQNNNSNDITDVLLAAAVLAFSRNQNSAAPVQKSSTSQPPAQVINQPQNTTTKNNTTNTVHNVTGNNDKNIVIKS